MWVKLCSMAVIVDCPYLIFNLNEPRYRVMVVLLVSQTCHLQEVLLEARDGSQQLLLLMSPYGGALMCKIHAQAFWYFVPCLLAF